MMHKPHNVHSWNVTPSEAIALQKQLRAQVTTTHLQEMPQTIAGCDISFNRFSNVVYAGFVVFSFLDLKEIDRSLIKTTATFPYIPGLLSFREIPALLEAWKQLKTKPDLVMVDGQGICHPRRLGIATHFGLMIDVPTIGAAKSLLTGIYEEPPLEAPSYSYIYDSFKIKKGEKEIIGAAVRTKSKVKPMIISPGHKVSMEQSIDLVLKCIKKHRMPEPTRLVHEAVNEFRRQSNEV